MARAKYAWLAEVIFLCGVLICLIGCGGSGGGGGGVNPPRLGTTAIATYWGNTSGYYGLGNWWMLVYDDGSAYLTAGPAGGLTYTGVGTAAQSLSGGPCHVVATSGALTLTWTGELVTTTDGDGYCCWGDWSTDNDGGVWVGQGHRDPYHGPGSKGPQVP